MREPDPVRLRDEPESSAVAVEAPGTALLDDFEAGFVVPVHQLVGHLAGGSLVGQLDCLGAEPLNADDGDQGVRQKTADGGVRTEVFELDQLLTPGR